ncbi:unnamed protein product, partial [Rotaria magnacalcarata]
FGCLPNVSGSLSSPPRSTSFISTRPSSSNFNSSSWNTNKHKSISYSHVAVVEATTSPVNSYPRYLQTIINNEVKCFDNVSSASLRMKTVDGLQQSSLMFNQGSTVVVKMPNSMKTLIRKLMQLERQLVFMKILYNTNNDHLIAGLALYTMRDKKKGDSTLFEDLFSSSFVQAIPILEDLKNNDRFFTTW